MAKQKANTIEKPKTSISEKQVQTKAPAGNTIPQPSFLFGRENYLIMGGGLLLLAIGFMLMAGGSQPPDQFDPNVIYSFRRVTLSTIVAMMGFAVVLGSIFWKRKSKS